MCRSKIQLFTKALKKVKEIQATQSAFAAIKADGSVVTWGNVQEGGAPHRAAQAALKDVP